MAYQEENKMNSKVKLDLQAYMDKDPAATSKASVFFTYPGFRAVYNYRIAHWFYTHKMKFFARLISKHSRFKTGVEIHPAAIIGTGMVIDHGCGVVIGETTEIGNNVIIYQGVTLGGTGKDVGKRHPTIMDNVMISAGAKVLGPITIGENCKIGAGSVVLKNVPPHSTVVGIPGRVVKTKNERVADLNQTQLPDPILEEFTRLNKRICTLEEKLNIQTCKYSITNIEPTEDEFFNETSNSAEAPKKDNNNK
ncbi:MAG: serine O-acetyltransferase [Clostridia bacterium]